MSDGAQERAAPIPVDALNPIALIVPVAVVGLAVLVLTRRNNTPVQKAAGATARKAAGPAARVAARQTMRQARRRGRNTTRRVILTLVINALENDAMRRAVIMGLKVARSRL